MAEFVDTLSSFQVPHLPYDQALVHVRKARGR